MFSQIIKTIIISIILSFLTSAQDNTGDFIGINFGGSDYHVKDEHISPLIFGSLGIAPSLQYLHKGDKTRHYAEISYYYDYLHSSNSNFTADNYRARLRYSLLYKISDFTLLKEDVQLFIGGSANSFFCHNDYWYYLKGINFAGKSGESWYWSHSLDLSLMLESNISDREFISLNIFLPLISNVSRPKYSPSGDFNYIVNDWKFKFFGETKLFNKNFPLNILLSYQKPVIGNFSLQLNYEFFYTFYNKPKDISMYMNNFRAGIFFCF